jgi:ribose/xylose/arabinose/galactoside ABC-type transport system permease subunit
MTDTAHAAARSSRVRFLEFVERLLNRFGIYLALLLLLIATAILQPAFFAPSSLNNVLKQAATLGIVAVGQTFVILGSGIDLSVGAVMGLATIIVAGFSQGRNESLPIYIALCLLMGAVVGLANGLLVTKRNVPPFVATLGMYITIEGARQAYTKGIPSGAIPPFLRIVGAQSTWGIPNAVIVLVFIVVAMSVLLYRTKFGRSLYATGGNREVARLSGIRVDRVIIGTYIICATLASVAGLVLGGFIGYVDRYLGRGFDLDSVASVVAGGTTFAGGVGGLGGTVAGVLLITVLNNLVLMLNLGVQYQLAVKGVVIIVAVALYSFRGKS